MRVKRRRLRPARVEMLPLIDVVFLLLVFFIYAMLSMSLHRGLRLDLPVSSESEVERAKVVQLSVTPGEGVPRLQLDGETVALTELGPRLSQLGDGPAEEGPQVLLFAAEGLTYQQLFQVLDELKKGGITSLSLQARAE